MSWYRLCHIVNRWEHETLNLNNMCPVPLHHNTDDCAGRKTSCSSRTLICQVGLVKNSTGRERDGGDLPWPVSDTEETQKKVSDEFPVWLPALCGLHQLSYQTGAPVKPLFPCSLNGHLYGSWKGFPVWFLDRIMTLYVEGMSAFYLTIWESREGKFNENTSKVIGEMSASCLSWMSPATQANNHTPLSADLGVTKKESSLQVAGVQ